MAAKVVKKNEKANLKSDESTSAATYRYHL